MITPVHHNLFDFCTVKKKKKKNELVTTNNVFRESVPYGATCKGDSALCWLQWIIEHTDLKVFVSLTYFLSYRWENCGNS